ncbi:MAG: superoxide dismutase, partial [Phormidesmis sp.]
AVSDYPDLQTLSPEDLIEQLDSLPEEVQTAVRNNGGGHLNHSMFWEIMSPAGGGAPTGAIAAALETTFGSFDEFKSAFNGEGRKRFGSGWAWLVLDSDKTLQVTNTGNQDSPLMNGLTPIMGNDVWEHAYYLNYRNRRAEYLEAWWNVVNWLEVNRRYEIAMA